MLSQLVAVLSISKRIFLFFGLFNFFPLYQQSWTITTVNLKIVLDNIKPQSS